jgi:hypothetical protein
MNQTLLQLVLNLLLTTAASIGQPAAPQVGIDYAATPAPTLADESPAAAVRRSDRAARVSLVNPYYSFGRAKRVASKD